MKQINEINQTLKRVARITKGHYALSSESTMINDSQMTLIQATVDMLNVLMTNYFEQEATSLDDNQAETAEVTKSNKGFTPETLEFDGIKIEGGDKVCLGGDYTEYTVSNVYTINYHEHVTGDEAYIDLVDLNITAHYPAKDKKLELLEHILDLLISDLDANYNINSFDFNDWLEHYYQARKTLEEAK